MILRREYRWQVYASVVGELALKNLSLIFSHIISSSQPFGLLLRHRIGMAIADHSTAAIRSHSTQLTANCRRHIMDCVTLYDWWHGGHAILWMER
jgi:hypothetical protein